MLPALLTLLQEPILITQNGDIATRGDGTSYLPNPAGEAVVGVGTLGLFKGRNRMHLLAALVLTAMDAMIDLNKDC